MGEGLKVIKNMHRYFGRYNFRLSLLVLLQFSWRRGSKGSRIQGFKGLFSKGFISAFNILSISAMSLFSVPNSPFSIKSKSPANNIYPVK